MIKFSNEEKTFLQQNVKGRTSEELTICFNQRFNRQLTINQIKQYKKSHKLRSGINTKFKQNNKPHNYKPIGSEFINNNGYVFIKVADPNEWELKHRYLYKKYKGSIPNDCCVIFADSNKRNFNLDNLILVEISDKLTAKNKHLLFDKKELTETGILIAKIINKRSKRGDKNE